MVEVEDQVDPRCMAFCKASNSCHASTDFESECKSNCPLLDGLDEASGCDDEFDAVLACEEGVMNVCDDVEESQCDTQNTVWHDCAVAYCTANPDSSFC